MKHVVKDIDGANEPTMLNDLLTIDSFLVIFAIETSPFTLIQQQSKLMTINKWVKTDKRLLDVHYVKTIQKNELWSLYFDASK